MKVFATGLVALIAGYLLGAWPLQSEVARLEDQVEAMSRKLADAGPRKPSLGGIGRMLNVPSESPDNFDDIPDPTLDPEPIQPEDDEEQAVVKENARPRRTPRSFEENIDKAVELWRVRSDLARGAFLSQVEASEEDSLRFDVVLAAMNVRLESAIQQWAGVLAEESVSQQEAGIRMMHEITEALTITYDELDRTMAADWKTSVGDTFELTDFIDPSVALPLVEVEDKLDFQ